MFGPYFNIKVPCNRGLRQYHQCLGPKVQDSKKDIQGKWEGGGGGNIQICTLLSTEKLDCVIFKRSYAHLKIYGAWNYLFRYMHML